MIYTFGANISMNVGFIGLGTIGGPIAARLALRHNVLVWNRTHDKATEHALTNNTHCVKKLDDFGNIDCLFACLPTTKESGFIFRNMSKTLSKPITFVDISSGDFKDSIDIARDVKPHRYIDAPVSGGVSGAVSGTLTSMVGVPELPADIRCLMDTYCKHIFECGGIGHGNAIKSVNNFLNVTHLMLASDALIHLKLNGIDPEIAVQAINNSSGRSLQTEIRIPNEVMTGRFNYGFKLNLMVKDVKQSKSILEKSIYFKSTAEILKGHENNENDYTTIVKSIENKNNIQIRKDFNK